MFILELDRRTRRYSLIQRPPRPEQRQLQPLLKGKPVLNLMKERLYQRKEQLQYDGDVFKMPCLRLIRERTGRNGTWEEQARGCAQQHLE